MIGVVNGVLCDFKWCMNVFFLFFYLCGLKIVCFLSVYIFCMVILGGVRSNIKFLGVYCIVCCVKFFVVLRYFFVR